MVDVSIEFAPKVRSVVSSAHIKISDSMSFSMSFMYTIKSSGPNLEPCGTPDVTCLTSDFTLSTTVTCRRLDRYD